MNEHRKSYPNELYHYGVKGMKWKEHKYGNLTAEEYYERVRQKLAQVRARTNKTTSTLKEKAAEYKPRDVLRRRTNSDGKIKFDKDGNAYLVRNKPQYEIISDGGKKKSSPSMKLPSQTGVDVRKEREEKAAAQAKAEAAKKKAVEKKQSDINARLDEHKQRVARYNRDWDTGGTRRRTKDVMRGALGEKTVNKHNKRVAYENERRHALDERRRQERELDVAPMRAERARRLHNDAVKRMREYDANRIKKENDRATDAANRKKNARDAAIEKAVANIRTGAKRTYAMTSAGLSKARKQLVRTAAEGLISSGHGKAGRAIYRANDAYEDASRMMRKRLNKERRKTVGTPSNTSSKNSTTTEKKTGSWKSTPDMHREAQYKKKKQQIKDITDATKKAAKKAADYYSDPAGYTRRKNQRKADEAVDRRKARDLAERDARARAESMDRERARQQALRDADVKRDAAVEDRMRKKSKKKKRNRRR